VSSLTFFNEILKGTKPASTRGTADELRAGDKSQDSEADWSDDSANVLARVDDQVTVAS
jgi:hypothetical protein